MDFGLFALTDREDIRTLSFKLTQLNPTRKMPRPWVSHMAFTPLGENHATFSVQRDRQEIADVRHILQEERVPLDHLENQLGETLQNLEAERRVIEQGCEELKTRMGDLEVSPLRFRIRTAEPCTSIEGAALSKAAT
jgi:hypothetical protein